MKIVLVTALICSLAVFGCTKAPPSQEPAPVPSPNNTLPASETPTALLVLPPTTPPPVPTTPTTTPPVIPPGGWILNKAVLLYAHSINLKAGETKSVDVTLETRESGPGEFSGVIFRTDKEYSHDTLPIPKGLEVSLEPPKIMASPNNTYHLSITIKTTTELAPGGYWLRFEHNFENVFRGSGWIVVGVE